MNPAALGDDIALLVAAGFTLIRKGVALGHALRLEVNRRGERYQLIFEDNYLRGGLVLARALVLGDDGNLRPTTEYATAAGPLGASIALLNLGTPRRRRPMPNGGRALIADEWNYLPTGERGTIEYGLSAAATAFVPLRLSGPSDADSKRLSAVAAPLARAFPPAASGLWVRGEPNLISGSPESRAVAIEKQLAVAHGLPLASLRRRLRTEVGALFAASNAVGTWHFVRRSSTGASLMVRGHRLGRQLVIERAPYAADLATCRVTIVGCGAVGWAVATLLARSGVRHFTLYDADTIEAANLARVGAFLTEVGLLKVRALATQLEAAAAGVEAAYRPAFVGRHVGALALVEDLPDLILNFTGEELSTDECNLAALYLNKPAIFAWVSYGIAQARIFRVRPFVSACYECVREAAPTRIRGSRRSLVNDDHPWPGSVIDVATFAAAVAQVAVRTLRGRPVDQHNPDHLQLDFEGLTLSARRIEIRRNPQCTVCGK